MIFSDSTIVSAYNGKAYDGQKIGMAQDTDGEYYWAIVDGDKVEWLYDDIGRMVQASPTPGIAPVFVLDNSFGDGKYYWAYKYGKDGGMRYLYDKDGKKVVASDTNVVQLFSKVEIKDSYVLFTPLAGDPFYVPRYSPFQIVLSSTSVNLPAPSGPVSITYEVRDVPSTVAITAITETGYYVAMTKQYDASKKKLSGTITITADISAAAKSTVLVLVSDGKGHMETYKISVTKV